MSGGGIVRAFADDTAVLFRDLSMLPGILDIFQTYGDISNLRLNLPKTFLIPLFSPDSLETARERARAMVREAAAMRIEWSAMYLGAKLGPEGFASGWMEPLRKCYSRLAAWSAAHMGTLGGREDLPNLHLLGASILLPGTLGDPRGAAI